MRQVEIHYRRPPYQLDIFVQDLVVDEPEYKVTLHEPSTVTAPRLVGDKVIYEPGAPLVWFVFPGAWYDLGLFHLKDGSFTGYYVNLIAPVETDGAIWRMYDLCLDLWVEPDGRFQVLDQDEFDEAVDRQWIDAGTAQRAKEELERLIGQVSGGDWPPEIVRDYELAKVRALRTSD
jgi:predicted RNA-binding protein associated with RNAse of E/G family